MTSTDVSSFLNCSIKATRFLENGTEKARITMQNLDRPEVNGEFITDGLEVPALKLPDILYTLLRQYEDKFHGG